MKDFQQDVLSLVILNLNNVDLCFPVQVTRGNVRDFFHTEKAMSAFKEK